MNRNQANIEPEVLDELVEFHGHMCPGLAMGVLAARVALDEIGPHANDEEVVAVTETDMCGVDAVQFLTGCTFGKGNLIHNDYGKVAFTFYRRSDGKAVRVAARHGAMEADPDHQALRARVFSGEATDEERDHFRALHRARSMQVLSKRPEDLFDVERFSGVAPPRARIHNSIRCVACGEGVMATRVHSVNGEQFCTPCYASRFGSSEGSTPPASMRNLLES